MVGRGSDCLQWGGHVGVHHLPSSLGISSNKSPKEWKWGPKSGWVMYTFIYTVAWYALCVPIEALTVKLMRNIVANNDAVHLAFFSNHFDYMELITNSL